MRTFTSYLRLIMTGGFLFLFGTFVLSQNYRTISGLYNNLVHPDWGSAGTKILVGPNVGYADGISAPAGPDRPNPRMVSNTIFLQNTMTNDPRGVSAFAWGWGQFIDHDLTLVPDHPFEKVNIPIPAFDPFFDPTGTGTAIIPLKRSDYDPTTGTSTANPRVHINAITAYLDGSAVYGSDSARATWLRSFSGGKLRTSAGNLMPYNTTTGEYGAPVDPSAPHMAMPLPFVYKYFVAGDDRANENPFLISMHTLFVREHNRICDELAVKYPDWTDEQLYQRARKLVGGIIEAIVYEEWLPTVGLYIEPYNGYDIERNPGIMNVFSAAAFRYGHTTLTSTMFRMDNDGNYVPQGNILLRDAFFNIGAVQEVGGIEPYLIGMSTMVQQDFDCKVIDDVRNFLFGAPGAGGMDLVAINLNRGRERGLPDYNTIRQEFGLSPVNSFDEMTGDPLMNLTLENIYHDIDNVDPWVGFLSENHMSDALFGETAMTILKKQFTDIRDGDRFYYENDVILTPEEKTWIKNTRLADVIRRNCPITCIHDNVFMAQPVVSSVKETANFQLEFSLYPNPAKHYLTIFFESQKVQQGTIQLTDMLGRVVRTEKVNWTPGINEFAMTLAPSMPSGLYQAVLQLEGARGHQTFVKK